MCSAQKRFNFACRVLQNKIFFHSPVLVCAHANKLALRNIKGDDGHTMKILMIQLSKKEEKEREERRRLHEGLLGGILALGLFVI